MAKAHTHGQVKRENDEDIPIDLNLRQRDQPDEPHYEDPVEGRRVPARPGTTETGLPDRDDIGKMDRSDLREQTGGNVQPTESAEGPSQEDFGRLDRREFSGWRGQRDERDERDKRGGARGAAQGHREQR